MFTWYYVFVPMLILLVIKNITATVWLHRDLGHRSIKVTSKSFIWVSRILLWFTGFWWERYPKHWATIHALHHINSDSPGDPHSPWIYSFRDIVSPNGKLYGPGRVYYVSEEEIKKYAEHAPDFDDKFENFCIKYPKLGPWLMVGASLIFFGIYGFAVTCVFYLLVRHHTRFFDFISHKWGYRHRPARGNDRSRNFYPFGFFWLPYGEDLAGNHHDNPGHAKFSEKWYEIDLGYGIAKVMEYFNMVKILKVN